VNAAAGVVHDLIGDDGLHEGSPMAQDPKLFNYGP